MSSRRTCMVILGSTVCQFFQGLTDQAGIGSTARRFHHLADKEAHQFLFTATLALYLCRVGSHHLFNDGINGTAITHLFQTFGLNNDIYTVS